MTLRLGYARQSWRDGLFILGVFYAGAWMAAEWRAGGDGHIFRFNDVQSASEMFPLDHHLRMMPVYSAIEFATIIPPLLVLRELELGLMMDPYARDLEHDRIAMWVRLTTNAAGEMVGP